MIKPKDITGLKFGKLTAIKLHHTEKKNNCTKHFWLCKCDCGNEIIVCKQNLTNNNTQSCGCLKEKLLLDTDNIIGKKFGHLTVLKLDHKKQIFNSSGKKNGWFYYYLCECECGNECIVERKHLLTKHSQSCGCHKVNLLKERTTTHNKRYTKIYNVWCGIKGRCYNLRQISYKHYGAKGIIMCDEWLNDFMNFYNWSMANGYKEGLSIDRIDINGNYEPSNCRWTDDKTQARNTTTNNYITYNGETHCLTEWAELYGLSYGTLKARLNRKWSFEEALTTPLKTSRK